MTAKNMGTLSQLAENKTSVFYSPLEGRDVLVRTGMSDRGNSFVRSFLYAYSKDFSQKSSKEKDVVLAKVMKKLTKNFNRGDISSRTVLREKFISLLQTFYDEILSDRQDGEISGKLVKNDKDISAYSIVCEALPLEQVDEGVIANIFNGSKVGTDLRDLLISKVTEFVETSLNGMGGDKEDQKIKFCVDRYGEVIKEAFKIADKYTAKKHKNQAFGESTDARLVEAVSEEFGRDIYLIDAKTRRNFSMGVEPRGRKSVIILWIGGIRYEVVGKLLDKNRIQRQFDLSDPLIRSLSDDRASSEPESGSGSSESRSRSTSGSSSDSSSENSSGSSSD